MTTPQPPYSGPSSLDQQPPTGSYPVQPQNPVPYGQQDPNAYGQMPPGGYPQNGYANPYPGAYQPAPKKKGGKGGKITFFIGLPLLIIGLILTIWGGVSFGKFVSQMMDRSETAAFTSSTTYDSTNNGNIVMVMSKGQGNCTVKDPSGSPVILNNSNSAQSGNFTSIGGFTATSAGKYAITCTGSSGFFLVEMSTGTLMSTTLGLGLGIPLGILGFIISLVGLIMWLSGRNKSV